MMTESEAMSAAMEIAFVGTRTRKDAFELGWHRATEYSNSLSHAIRVKDVGERCATALERIATALEEARKR